MVCIIDDREDVWNYAPNLITVKPYKFFKGADDINNPFKPESTLSNENIELIGKKGVGTEPENEITSENGHASERTKENETNKSKTEPGEKNSESELGTEIDETIEKITNKKSLACNTENNNNNNSVATVTVKNTQDQPDPSRKFFRLKSLNS